MFCDVLLSTTLPKLKLFGLAVSCPAGAAVAVPLRVIVIDAPALFATVMLPVAPPTAVGANLTASVAVAEGFNVNGAVTPLTLNPAPASATPVICSAAFPVLVKVIFCEALLPTATLPKLKLFVLAVNCPTGAVVAVPDNTIVRGEPAASLATVMLPVAFPVTLGANFTASVAFSDAFSVTGAVTPLTLNPLPPALILVIWTAAVPVFVTVTFCVIAAYRHARETHTRRTCRQLSQRCRRSCSRQTNRSRRRIWIIAGNSNASRDCSRRRWREARHYRNGLARTDCLWRGNSADPEFSAIQRNHGNR